MKKQGFQKHIGVFFFCLFLLLVWPAAAFADGKWVCSECQTENCKNFCTNCGKEINVGDTIVLGKWEQDNVTENGQEPIEWLILKKDEGKALLISWYALDNQPYDMELKDVTWESCSLRTWLNADFFASAFTTQEAAAILETTVKAEINPVYYETTRGKDTQDKLFLLSISEEKQYLSNQEKQCRPTEYAKAHGIDEKNENSGCWLRTSGYQDNAAAFVNWTGFVSNYGCDVNCKNGICPVCWVDLDELWKTNASANADGGEAALSVGDQVMLGTYEQDNDLTDGTESIEWLVLAVEDGKAFLVSRYGLDCQPYHTEDAEVTWETCSLRNWLNETFFSSAFTAEEAASILETNVTAWVNPDYGTPSGNNVQDRIFLMSIGEASAYFASDSERECCPTEYAKAQGAYMNDETGTAWWWLRSSGYEGSLAARVDLSGYVSRFGRSVEAADVCVRPALWIRLENITSESAVSR